eukprot:364818-Chlamydomonas_euryale.AAC.22
MDRKLRVQEQIAPPIVDITEATCSLVHPRMRTHVPCWAPPPSKKLGTRMCTSPAPLRCLHSHHMRWVALPGQKSACRGLRWDDSQRHDVYQRCIEGAPPAPSSSSAIAGRTPAVSSAMHTPLRPAKTARRSAWQMSAAPALAEALVVIAARVRARTVSLRGAVTPNGPARKVQRIEPVARGEAVIMAIDATLEKPLQYTRACARCRAERER